MNNEEEKIIRQVKTMLENATPFDMPPSRYNALKTMVKLIEKQQKEIERFNNELDLDYVDNNFVSKDKIRDKIEGLYKGYERHKNQIIKDIIQKEIQVLESLLEE